MFSRRTCEDILGILESYIMEQTPMTTKRAVAVLGITILFLVITVVMPAKWLGVDSTNHATEVRKKIIFKTRDELLALRNDKNKNQVPDWKDTLLSNTSEEIKARAAKVQPSETDLALLNDPNNQTSSFAKNIYTASAYLGQGATLTTKDQETFVSNLISKEASRETPATYTLKDIKVTSDDSMKSKTLYGNKLAILLDKANKANLGDSDLLTIKDYTEKKDPKILTFFADKKASVDLILKELLATQVPVSASLYHLMMANALSRYSFILENFSRMAIDPLKGLSAVQNYEQVNNALNISAKSLMNYFKDERVVFSTKDPGYVFIK